MKKILGIFFISLFVSNSSYSEPVTVKNTKWHHMDIKKHFEIITDNVRLGKSAQKFEIRHGECKKQDCKWGAHRTERHLKKLHYSSKKFKDPEYYDYESIGNIGKKDLFEGIETHSENTLEELNKGLFANRLITHDIFNKKIETHDFDYHESFGEFFHLEHDQGARSTEKFMRPLTYFENTGKSFSDFPMAKLMNKVETSKVHNDYEFTPIKDVLPFKVSQRAQMAKEMKDLELLAAEEEASLQRQRVGLDIGEVQGQQAMAADARRAAAMATQAGVQGLVDIAMTGLESQDLFADSPEAKAARQERRAGRKLERQMKRGTRQASRDIQTRNFLDVPGINYEPVFGINMPGLGGSMYS